MEPHVDAAWAWPPSRASPNAIPVAANVTSSSVIPLAASSRAAYHLLVDACEVTATVLPLRSSGPSIPAEVFTSMVIQFCV